MILFLHFCLIFKKLRRINFKCFMIQFTIGAIYYLIYNLGYYQIYGKNEYQSNTLMDLGITTFAAEFRKAQLKIGLKDIIYIGCILNHH